MMSEWTDADLDLLQSLDAANASIETIARRLGRPADEIEAQLPIVRARRGAIPFPGEGNQDETYHPVGPDEEGDVPPPLDRPADDTAAWVHIRDDERTG